MSIILYSMMAMHSVCGEHCRASVCVGINSGNVHCLHGRLNVHGIK